MEPKRYEFASQKEIGYLTLWVDEIMAAMCEITDEPLSFFVSDLSMIGDFPLEGEEFAKLGKDLGIEVKPEDFVVDLAKRLKKVRETL